MTVYDDLVGQRAVVAELQRAVAAAGTPDPTRSFTHAWLFTGPPGSGRSIAAGAFAAALQCPDDGCGLCNACRTVRAGSHGDVTIVSPSGLSIPVDQAREIVRRVSSMPTSGRWQIVVIEDADRLTEAAANALLKAIEEPSPRGVFLLCAPSPDDVPITIVSRCRSVALRAPSSADVAAVLMRRDGVDEAMASFAAQASQGHVGRARRLATDEAARISRAAVLEVPLQVMRGVPDAMAAAAALVDAAGDVAEAVSSVRDAAETAAYRDAYGENATGRASPRGSAGLLKDLEKRQKARATRTTRDTLDGALLDLAAFYRDVLLRQVGAAVPSVHGDQESAAARIAEATPPEATLRRIEAILSAREALGLNVAPQLALEAMALALNAG
ncbi:MAG: polymerase subunit delta [Frankiaceae bacterium]|nr:polymerase subunit delta [Frankiaceae bacterium]